MYRDVDWGRCHEKKRKMTVRGNYPSNVWVAHGFHLGAPRRIQRSRWGGGRSHSAADASARAADFAAEEGIGKGEAAFMPPGRKPASVSPSGPPGVSFFACSHVSPTIEGRALRFEHSPTRRAENSATCDKRIASPRKLA